MRCKARGFLRAKPGYTPQGVAPLHTFPGSARTMPIHVVAAQRQIFVGQPVTIIEGSPQGQFSAAFEDDGETGYFYALDRPGQPAHPGRGASYDGESVTDRRSPTVGDRLAADCRKGGAAHQRLPARGVRL